MKNVIKSQISQNSFTENITLNNKKKPYKLFIILGIILVVLLVIGYFIYDYFSKRELDIDSVLNNEMFYNGIIISDVDLSGKSLDEAKEILHEKENSIKLRNDIHISVVYDNKEVILESDDFKLLYNTDDVINEAYNLYRDGNKYSRYKKIKNLENDPKYYEIEVSIDKSDISGSIKKVSEGLNTPAQEAKVSSFNVKSENKFTYTEGHDGLELDKSKLNDDILELLNNGDFEGTVVAEMQVIKNNTSIEDLRARTVLLGKFSTTSTNSANANHNMKLALSFVNGKTVEPSETFSFNNNVGDTNSSRDGYKTASVISGGRNVQEYGGGVCQAATTIYGAAIRANMTIVERHCHQWKSTYVDYGLDATVYSPNLDFIFRNDTEYPVYIGSYMNGAVLTCEIYGYKPDWYDYIEPTSKVVKTIPQPPTKYINDSSLSPGQQIVYVNGRTGYVAEASRIYYKDSREIKRESLPSSHYDAIAAVIKVGS